MVRRLALLSILWTCAFCLKAQITQQQRFEKVVKYSGEAYNIVPLKEEGLLLVRDKEKYESGKKLWEVILLDTALQERTSFDISTDTRNRFIGWDYTPENAFILFRKGEHEKSELDLIVVNLNSFSSKSYSIVPELSINLTHFNAVGHHVILGGYVNKEPAVILYDLDHEGIKVLPGLFQKDTELVDLRINKNNTFNVVFIDRAVRENKHVLFRTFDEFGELLLEDQVSLDPKINLQTGITSILEREDLMLLGTWGEGNSKLSNGFYAMTVDPFSEQKINFVAYGELNQALDYLSPNRSSRIQQKTKEELAAGGIPNFATYTMPYRIQEHKGGFILFAEIYSQTTNYTNYGYPYSPYYYGSMYSPGSFYYPGYGRMYSRPYAYNQMNNTSNDTKTYESLAICFDANGKIKWDASINLDEVKQSALDQVGEFYYNDTNKNHILFLYKDESELKTKIIDLENGEVQELTEKIKLKDDKDDLRSENEFEGGVKHWFEDTYYVWGFQTIKNPSNEDRTRNVFYINKVVAQ